MDRTGQGLKELDDGSRQTVEGVGLSGWGKPRRWGCHHLHSLKGAAIECITYRGLVEQE